MNNNKIIRTIGGIDDELIERAALKNKKPRNKFTLWLKWILPAAACLIIAVVITVPILNNNEFDKQDFEPLFIGLPVDNFSLADLHTNNMDYRMAYSKLNDFFTQYNSVPDMFVFVRVIDTEQIDETPSYSASSRIRQNSSVQILSTVWSRDSSTPETLSVTQYLSGGCCADEPTNLLREGGVYLLPLSYGVNSNTWHIGGDLDVLFEVDDKGRVWSHSAYDGFKQFDGEDVNILLEAITTFTSDENFSAAVSRFGLIVRGNWAILMETTFLSVIPAEDRYDNDCYINTFIVDNILSSAAERLSHPAGGDEIEAKSYTTLTSIHLEQSERYLIFYAPDEYGGTQIDTEIIAKINDDDTITELFVAYDYHRAFEGYNGYTVEQMKEEAERAKAWHEAHVK